MLYSDIPPCLNYTAGIVLNKMCDFLLDANHEICCFYIESKSLDSVISADKKEKITFMRIIKPYESYGVILKGILGKLLSLLGNNYTAFIRLPKIIKQATVFAKKNEVELIWSVVQGQTMIKTTRRLAKKAQLQYIIQICDPPTWWLRENRFDRYTTYSVLKEFGKAIHNSKCCITVSKAMNEEYLKRYNPPKAVSVILGFEPSRINPRTKNSNFFVIILSGQVYAAQEILALIAALELLNWNYNGKRIVLKLYGRSFSIIQNILFSSLANIYLCGWLSQDELLFELAAADLLYCPYWFDSSFREEASLSFPSKLSTYLKTGTPVLVHAPEYASPRIFIEENNAGYVCDSLDKNLIAETLIKIMSDKNRTEIGERGFKAFQKHLTIDIMRKNFLEALGE